MWDVDFMKNSIDFLSIVPKERFYCRINKDMTDKLVIKLKNIDKLELISKLKISKNTLNRIIHKKDYWINLDTLFGLCQSVSIPSSFAKKNILSMKTKDSTPIEKFQLYLTEEFCRVVGHVLADGGIHIIEREGKYRVFYVNNESILLDSFANDVKTIFGDIDIYKRIREKHGDEIWLPSTIGLILYNIFDMYKSGERRVPSFILNLDKIKVSAFLQAFFDDEGYLYPKKKIIGLSLKNKYLLNDIKELLKILGINSNPIHIHKSKERSEMYYFNITGYKNLFNFYNKVGFLHPEKKRKVNELISSYGG